MVNYSHQAPMKRLGKLPEKRGKEAEVASLGRSRFHFKFPIRCQTAVAVTKRLRWYSWGCWIWWWGCWCFRRNLHGFFAETWRWAGRDSPRRMSMKNQKELQFRVSDRERDILDLFHVAPAWTNSCFSRDFHLKPAPVTANRARLIQSGSEWVTFGTLQHLNRLLLALLPCFRFLSFNFSLCEHFFQEWVVFGTCKAPVKVQLWRTHHSL